MPGVSWTGSIFAKASKFRIRGVYLSGGRILLGLFTDIFSYISKTTGPILTWFSVTCSDGPGMYTEQHKIKIVLVVFEI